MLYTLLSLSRIKNAMRRMREREYEEKKRRRAAPLNDGNSNCRGEHIFFQINRFHSCLFLRFFFFRMFSMLHHHKHRLFILTWSVFAVYGWMYYHQRMRKPSKKIRRRRRRKRRGGMMTRQTCKRKSKKIEIREKRQATNCYSWIYIKITFPCPIILFFNDGLFSSC